MDDVAERMLAITKKYSAADVAAFMPYLVCTFASTDEVSSSPAAAAIVGALAQKLGITDPAQAVDILREHFEEHPPNRALVADFERLFREALGENAALGTDTLARVMGASTKDPARTALSTVGAERPAGTTRASPFARHQMHSQQKRS
jgi:hypothetical protein